LPGVLMEDGERRLCYQIATETGSSLI